ncbi:hypothetical protein ACLOJK_015071, partial [Asimina triloba]
LRRRSCRRRRLRRPLRQPQLLPRRLPFFFVAPSSSSRLPTPVLLPSTLRLFVFLGDDDDKSSPSLQRPGAVVRFTSIPLAFDF